MKTLTTAQKVHQTTFFLGCGKNINKPSKKKNRKMTTMAQRLTKRLALSAKISKADKRAAAASSAAKNAKKKK